MDKVFKLIDRLEAEGRLSPEEMLEVLSQRDKELLEYLRAKARRLTDRIYGRNIYVRGLVEFSNFCQRDCRYCGIRRSNKKVRRYRLGPDQILGLARKGYDRGFRTLVLQSGEDPYYGDQVLVDLIRNILGEHPDLALTLSIGVRSRDSYRRLREAGASRYLLRHETIDRGHFAYLHPRDQSIEDRTRALADLKELGYAVGSGIMVGSPGQGLENLVQDLAYLAELEPDMIGLGPFVSHKDTIFRDHANGGLELSLKILSIVRLMFPLATIPATTALNTIDERGRILGIQHGANVLMPNLSPPQAKENYSLYDKKNSSGLESSENIQALDNLLRSYGYQLDYSVGHPKSKTQGEFYDKIR